MAGATAAMHSGWCKIWRQLSEAGTNRGKGRELGSNIGSECWSGGSWQQQARGAVTGGGGQGQLSAGGSGGLIE